MHPWQDFFNGTFSFNETFDKERQLKIEFFIVIIIKNIGLDQLPKLKLVLS